MIGYLIWFLTGMIVLITILSDNGIERKKAIKIQIILIIIQIILFILEIIGGIK